MAVVCAASTALSATSLARNARTNDTDARHALFRQAEDLLVADAPFIPLYTYTHVFLKNPSVQGWYPTLLDHHPYKHVSLQSNR